MTKKVFLAVAFIAFIAIELSAQTRWTIMDFDTEDYFCDAIVYGNGKFVAGGYYNGCINIKTSPNGTTWTAVKESPGCSFLAIAYGNGKFVAVGYGGEMATSPDGITWTEVPDSTFPQNIDGKINFILYGNNIFIATGEDGRMATSPDGIIWTVVSNPPFGKDDIRAIAFGNNKFVAVGRRKMATSTDGVTWTEVPNVSDATGIYFCNNKFIKTERISGSINYNKIATSTDGTNWSSVTNINIANIQAIAYGNNRFVVVGEGASEGRVLTATSLDGNWSNVTGIYNIYEINGIAFGNNRFVIVGKAGRLGKVAYSTN